MRSHVQYIAISWLFTVFNSFDLLTYRNQSVAKSVEFFFAFTLCRLDHQRICNRPGHSWSMETIVLQSFGNVDSLDPYVLELPHVQDKFMSATAFRIGVQNWIM